MIGLRTGVPDWLMSTLCYAAFIGPVYLAHRRFSFRSDAPHGRALPRYIAVQLCGLALASLFSYICYSVLGIPTIAAGILVIALTAGFNFVIVRTWAFATGPTIWGGGLMAALDPKAVLNSAHNALVFDRRIRILATHMARTIPEGGGTVLDLGCGDGSMDVLLMQMRPDLKIEGADVFFRPKSHIPMIQYDGTTLPFPDGHFDYVTIVDVLHHTDDPAGVLAEAARVSRKGVAIKDHLLEGFLAGPTLRLMDWVGNRGHGVRLPYNYLSNEQWRDAFARAGLGQKLWTEKLGLYPIPFSWLFERGLHFVALMTPKQAATA